MPISPPRTSSLNSGRLSNPNYADPYATPDTSDTTMPPMTQVSQPAATFQKGYANPSAHLLIPSENYYPVSNEPTTSFEDVAAQQKARSRKRWFIIGGIILAVAAVVGIVVGVVVSQVNKNDDDNNSNRSSNSTSSSGNGTLTIGSDPSTFEKDSRLHQVFWGFAYTPNVSGHLFSLEMHIANGNIRMSNCPTAVRRKIISLEIFRSVNITSSIAQS